MKHGHCIQAIGLSGWSVLAWLGFIPGGLPAQQVPPADWASLQGVQDLQEAFPEETARLLQVLDLDHPEMERVQDCVAANRTTEALEAVVAFFREKAVDWEPPLPTSTGFQAASVEAVLENTYTFQTVRDRVPDNPDGGLDWAYRGPHDDIEYGFFLNRHFDWVPLVNAYRETGEGRYGRHLDRLIRDWVLHNPRPAENTHSVQWRALEAGLRMGIPWPYVFYRFAPSATFSDAGLLLMLLSIHDHAEYLQAYHWRHHNHASMQMRGLAHVAVAFPEFREADGWFEHAAAVMTGELEYQFYPDGVQKELTAHYHTVSLRQFDALEQLSQRAGKALPDEFTRIREAAWQYLAASIRPDGHGPLNNDSDLDHNVAVVRRMAGAFDRPDWLYRITNGAEGRRPEGLPSAFFPWAGQLVSRSGWEASAHWSFFDAGPWGISHQHDDKLHLSVSAYGRDLLVDSGRFRYIPDAWRKDYFLHSRSHNVILVDGAGQGEDLHEVEAPHANYAILPELDYAMQDTGPLFGEACHSRAVLYLRDRYWIVLDRIQGEGPRSIQPLWHFHPDCTVVLDGAQAVTTDPGAGNLRIKPIAPFSWKADLVEGRELPDPQGWYSVQYNEKEPAPCAVYQAEVTGEALFAWLLYPANDVVPDPRVEWISGGDGLLHVAVDDGHRIEVQVNFSSQPRSLRLPDGTTASGRCLVTGLAERPVVVPGDFQ